MDSLTNHIEQAEKFLLKTGVSFKAEFKKYDIHFPGDKNKRDIYQITLTRGKRNFVFSFGQSIQSSGRFWKYGNPERGCSMGYLSKAGYQWMKPVAIGQYGAWNKNPEFSEPRAYDVLTCLTKYDPGSFADFCSEFGYDEDSRTADRTYQAVCEEWKNVQTIWTDDEITELREIQ